MNTPMNSVVEMVEDSEDVEVVDSVDEVVVRVEVEFVTFIFALQASIGGQC